MKVYTTVNQIGIHVLEHVETNILSFFPAVVLHPPPDSCHKYEPTPRHLIDWKDEGGRGVESKCLCIPVKTLRLFTRHHGSLDEGIGGTTCSPSFPATCVCAG